MAAKNLDRFSRVLGWLARIGQAVSAAGILLSLGLIGWAVVMRYGFNAAPVWVDEVVGFLLIAIVMLGAAEPMRRGEHIGVDLLVTRLGAAGRRRLSLWVGFATGLAAAILIVNGIGSIELARMLGLLTEGYLEWPVWILMLLLPVGGGLLGLASIEIIWRTLAGLPELPRNQS